MDYGLCGWVMRCVRLLRVGNRVCEAIKGVISRRSIQSRIESAVSTAHKAWRQNCQLHEQLQLSHHSLSPRPSPQDNPGGRETPGESGSESFAVSMAQNAEHRASLMDSKKVNSVFVGYGRIV